MRRPTSWCWGWAVHMPPADRVNRRGGLEGRERREAGQRRHGWRRVAVVGGGHVDRPAPARQAPHPRILA